jgi:hypothetical protein
MDQSTTTVSRFRLFFLYAIDLGYLLRDITDKKQLQILRAEDSFYKRFCELFNNSHISAASFSNPALEGELLRSRTHTAQQNGGKNIWSELFYHKHIPIKFMAEEHVPLSPSTTVMPRENLNLVGLMAKDNPTIKFDGCTLRIFREGTLSISFEFSQSEVNTKINVNELINILLYIEKITSEGFVYRIKEILNDWGNPGHSFKNLKIKLRQCDGETDGLIRTSSVKHSCIFIEGVRNNETSNFVSIKDLQSKYQLLGILNTSVWYTNYGERYIEKVFEKNVGYREDEIYVTDKDSSLILLADYWDPNKSLQYYVYDLVLATEIQIAKLSYLNFILNYMQEDPDSREALTNITGEKAINIVLQTRKILTLTQESLDINTLILHGFTRSFISRLNEEIDIGNRLESINRRIENISSAIQLKSSIDIGEQGISLNKNSLNWAIIVAIVTTFFSIVNLVLLVLNTVIAYWNIQLLSR